MLRANGVHLIQVVYCSNWPLMDIRKEKLARNEHESGKQTIPNACQRKPPAYVDIDNRLATLAESHRYDASW
jgi:hypothetical protein